jgi:hypothetical protein
LVLPKEWKEPPNTEKVGFSGKVVSLEKRKEPPGKEEVGCPGRVVFPTEKLQPGTMMPWSIGCSIARRREWGYPGQYRGCFSCEGRGNMA